MLSFFRQGMRIWAIWTLLITAALHFNPIGVFGSVELLACLGPLVLAAEPRIRREVAFVVGVPMITLLALLDPGDDSLIRLVTAWLVFTVGVLLIVRLIDGRRELEAIAGRVAFAPPSADAGLHFKDALQCEVGRARRHEKRFIVLAIAADANSLATAQPEAARNQLLSALAERRAHLEIHDLLADELHVYAEVLVDRDNVLALVPETEPDEVEPLVLRLRTSIREKLGLEVQVGRAAFPADAISGEDLVRAAVRARKATNLRPIHAASDEGLEEEIHDLASESQG